jgi:hypothetical protein
MTAMMIPSGFLLVQLDFVTSVVVYLFQFTFVKIRFKFCEPDYSNLMVLHRDWAHSTIKNDSASRRTSLDDTMLLFILVAITPYVKACLPHDLLVMERSSIPGIPHLGSVTDDDAPSNPLVKLVLGHPSCYVDAPVLYDQVMGRPAAGILDLGLLVEASACWKRTKLKRYESCTMLVTFGNVAHCGDRASRTAECYKVAQLVDPQDLDRGVDHGFTHHSSVMVHVDPPPPPEPPPCIPHPPSCCIDLVNQQPFPRSVKIEMLLVAWYFTVWLVLVQTATLVKVDFYTNCGRKSFVSGFPCRDRLADLLLSPVRYLGIPSHGESYVLLDYVFVVKDSFKPLHTITDDCRDVHSLRSPCRNG